MISIYKTIEDDMVVLDKIEEGCWISAIHPNEEELAFLEEETGIDLDDLRAPLDDEERSRIELEDGYNMILVDIPSLDEKDRYVTIPLGIYMTKEHIITICLEESPVLKAFVNRRVREFYTFKKTRFVFQILYRNAASYLRYLRIIDRKSDQIEEKLHISQKNSELIELLELEKSLVYFTTSLRSNEVVLEKLLRTERVKKYPEDEDEVESYLIALLNQQAFDRAGLIYGMGHAVYSISDPRARTFRKFVQKLADEKGLQKEFALYNLVEKLAPKVIANERHIYKGVSANIDFYSGLVYSMLGIPHELYTPIFAIGRIAGWSAHRLEELVNAGKIIRPAYKAVAKHKPYTPLSERD